MIAVLAENLQVSQIKREMRKQPARLDVINIHPDSVRRSCTATAASCAVSLENEHPNSAPLIGQQELVRRHIPSRSRPTCCFSLLTEPSPPTLFCSSLTFRHQGFGGFDLHLLFAKSRYCFPCRLLLWWTDLAIPRSAFTRFPSGATRPASHSVRCASFATPCLCFRPDPTVRRITHAAAVETPTSMGARVGWQKSKSRSLLRTPVIPARLPFGVNPYERTAFIRCLCAGITLTA